MSGETPFIPEVCSALAAVRTLPLSMYAEQARMIRHVGHDIQCRNDAPDR